MKHYPWLDGIRGLAALYVLGHHAAAEVNPRDLPRWVEGATRWLEHGHLAVAVFIVLSGFSIMLPVARHGTIRGGTRGYLSRRAWRILPPYYAALALSLILIAGVPVLREPNGNDRWDFALPALQAGPILSHLGLVHDLNSDWAFKINPPMWSVAVEWQIYFLFPILVAAWKRAGHGASLVLALALTALAGSLMTGSLYRAVCPWYLVLFASGMMAASVAEGSEPSGSRIFSLVALVWTLDLANSNSLIRLDILTGLVTAGTLAILARNPRVANRTLGSPPCVFLGSISYSLYLIHFPILSMISNQMLVEGINSRARLAVLIFGAVPGIVVLAWLFHQAFEKPFLAVRPAGPVASVSGRRLVRISRGLRAHARQRPPAIP